MNELMLNDFREYRFLSGIAFSPEGTHSALVAAQANTENDYDRILWVHTPGVGMRRMARLDAPALFFWEDENTLLFTARRTPESQKAKEAGRALTCFYRLSVLGGEAVEAFCLPLSVSRMEQLGAGRYLALAQYDTKYPGLTSPVEAERAQALGEREAQKDYRLIDEQPFWSNGHGFTNGLRSRLYLFDAADGSFLPLTGPEEEAEDFCLSADKRRVAVSILRTQPGGQPRNSLSEIEIGTYAVREVLPPVYAIGQMGYWGEAIVFTGTQGERYGLNQNHDFYAVTPGQADARFLCAYDYTIGAPVGSDCRLGGGKKFMIQGDAAYFASTQGFGCGIFSLSLRDYKIERLTPDGGSFDCFDRCGERMQAIAFRGLRLQELYEIGAEACERISDFNEEIHQAHPPIEPIHHTFVDADGYTIDGWAMLPPGYTKNAKIPAIVNIHGGPKSLFGPIYFHEMQCLAQAGYAVLFCNPRGSDGRGNDFADVRGHYGSFDCDNILTFLDEMLRAYPGIDPQRVGVMGGSYGGFMVNWMIGHTDRFCAAVSQRSIANWISFTSTSDIGAYFGPDQIGADVWKNPQKMWDASPLKYADRVKTPTLFLHSDEDYRCWVAEGYQMYTALKVHGVPTRLCVFRGENHELSRSGKPDHRERRLREIKDWMDAYLAPAAHR